VAGAIQGTWINQLEKSAAREATGADNRPLTINVVTGKILAMVRSHCRNQDLVMGGALLTKEFASF